jgi:hypothetical protein
MRTLVLWLVRPTTRALTYASCVGDESPALRKAEMRRGEARAFQVAGPSSSCAPWSNTPPDTSPSSPRPSCRGVLLPSGKTGPSASGQQRFRGCMPMAHAFVCLRFAARVSTLGARRATGSGGLTLGRMGYAPTGRCTTVHGGIASSNSLRPTGPGRTEILILLNVAEWQQNSRAFSCRNPRQKPQMTIWC